MPGSAPYGALLGGRPQVTGITDNMLQQEGMPLPEALSAFIDFVSAQCAPPHTMTLRHAP